MNRALMALTICTALQACGGKQPSAGSEEMTPRDSSGSSDTTATTPSGSSEEATHTMPDGTQMEGHPHGTGDDSHAMHDGGTM